MFIKLNLIILILLFTKSCIKYDKNDLKLLGINFINYIDENLYANAYINLDPRIRNVLPYDQFYFSLNERKSRKGNKLKKSYLLEIYKEKYSIPKFNLKSDWEGLFLYIYNDKNLVEIIKLDERGKIIEYEFKNLPSEDPIVKKIKAEGNIFEKSKFVNNLEKNKGNFQIDEYFVYKPEKIFKDYGNDFIEKIKKSLNVKVEKNRNIVFNGKEYLELKKINILDFTSTCNNMNYEIFYIYLVFENTNKNVILRGILNEDFKILGFKWTLYEIKDLNSKDFYDILEYRCIAK